MTNPSPRPSSFLDHGPTATAGSLAVLHLKRDLLVPTILSEEDNKDQGYDEGAVVNTRFGSFPHSTLIGVPWGSQVRASVVDTGSRGRRGPDGKGLPQHSKKRKRERDKSGPAAEAAPVKDGIRPGGHKTPVVASTGFVHLLPLTPESWTTSLPHRTQVVYTPDYSYILHRLRVRPGSVLIEAGAGSGSFTHAAARAVFNGYPDQVDDVHKPIPRKKTRLGRVLSYEFHEQRVQKLKAEVKEHGIESLVQITHRDVCRDGFAPNTDIEHPAADAIFLDLPAPWLALPHLSRSQLPEKTTDPVSQESPSPGGPSTASAFSNPSDLPKPALDTSNSTLERPPTKFKSSLNPHATIRICTFSPCIEQVQRTVLTLRQLNWLEVEVVEMAQKRIEVRRERIGLAEDMQRGTIPSAATVDEALGRLKEIEGRFRTFHADKEQRTERAEGRESEPTLAPVPAPPLKHVNKPPSNSRAAIIDGLVNKKLYKEGRIVHRTEPDIKNHTSYLVFAILPQEWSEEDEAAALRKWPVPKKSETSGSEAAGMSKRQMKKEARARHTKPVAGPTENSVDAAAHVSPNGPSVDAEVDMEMVLANIEAATVQE